MKALLIGLFIALPLALAVWTIPHLRRAFNQYRANPWTPKRWDDDE
ncbi:MAG TPA: hypothetical protein VM841_11410 [Actinomycetota bacterium]|nr:hypothetical protein [Actinomycetota bacterium]